MNNRSITVLGLVLVVGAMFGSLATWLVNDRSSAASSEAATNAVEAAPAPARWMLTYNGAIVLGAKFRLEEDCDKARTENVQIAIDQAKATIKQRWGKGVTSYEYPQYQQDLQIGKEEIRKAEAAYCQSYAD